MMINFQEDLKLLEESLLLFKVLTGKKHPQIKLQHSNQLLIRGY